MSSSSRWPDAAGTSATSSPAVSGRCSRSAGPWSAAPSAAAGRALARPGAPVVARTMALLRQLRDRTGLTVLLVEQNVRSALAVADQGVVMSLGQVVIAAPAAKLRDDVDLRHAYLGF
ncbi:hypothetical protein NKG94_06660 [Micromonospora sp. M12]